jgi:hypothetical protein
MGKIWSISLVVKYSTVTGMKTERNRHRPHMVIKIKRVNLKLSKKRVSFWTASTNGNSCSSKNLFKAILKTIEKP